MTRSGDFSATTRGGRKIRRGCLLLYFAAPDGGAASGGSFEESDVPTKVGLIVNRGVGNSVARHRVSRVIRHELAHWMDSMDPGSKLVVRALPQTGQRTNAKIARDLDRCLGSIAGGSNG